MLQPGITQEITFSVSNELTAKTVGSGTLDVLATPVMIARMEQAAWMAVAPICPLRRAQWVPEWMPNI